MFDVESYMQNITKQLQNCFKDRLLFVGLQGSYLRNEATENSDIDVVVILDGLSVGDLTAYKEIVSKLDDPQKSCGFICGKSEMQKWNPLEICGFLHGTKDYYGNLSACLPEYGTEDVVNFVKLSAGNLYHEISHRYVHADLQANKSGLPYSYKSVFFILQSLYYLKTGTFYLTKKELTEYLLEKDRIMMEKAARLAAGADFDFEAEFSALVAWCQDLLRDL